MYMASECLPEVEARLASAVSACCCDSRGGGTTDGGGAGGLGRGSLFGLRVGMDADTLRLVPADTDRFHMPVL